MLDNDVANVPTTDGSFTGITGMMADAVERR